MKRRRGIIASYFLMNAQMAQKSSESLLMIELEKHIFYNDAESSITAFKIFYVFAYFSTFLYVFLDRAKYFMLCSIQKAPPGVVPGCCSRRGVFEVHSEAQTL